MSEAKPKHKFWQFHLVTLVILILATAIVLLLNFSVRHSIDFVVQNDRRPYRSFFENCDSYGWPWTCYCWMPNLDRWNTVALGADIISALLILTLVGVILEHWIRRREAHKTEAVASHQEATTI
jgi:hypothetical protein